MVSCIIRAAREHDDNQGHGRLDKQKSLDTRRLNRREQNNNDREV